MDSEYLIFVLSGIFISKNSDATMIIIWISDEYYLGYSSAVIMDSFSASDSSSSLMDSIMIPSGNDCYIAIGAMAQSK